MQAGFATLSAGSIRAKNVKNILLKNLLDACIGAFAWYLLGYGFAYDIDDNTNPFIGTGPSHFALSGHKDWDGKENKGCQTPIMKVNGKRDTRINKHEHDEQH